MLNSDKSIAVPASFERASLRKRLAHRLRLERATTSLSSLLASTQHQALDRSLAHVLKQIGALIRPDYAFINLFSESGSAVERQFRWTVKGSSASRAQEGDVEVSIEQQPQQGEARQSSVYAQLGACKSISTRQLRAGESLVGVLGVGSKQDNFTWPEEDLRLLDVLGSMVANTVYRINLEKAIRDRRVGRFPAGAQSAQALEVQSSSLEQSYILLRSLINNLPMAVAVMDHNGNLTLVNKAGEDIWGTSQPQWNRVGCVQAELCPQSGHARSILEECGMMRALFSGQSVQDELIEIQGSDGQTHSYLASAFPIFNDDSSLRGVVGMMTDISEKLRLEEALRISERLSSLGTLATGIAHEINNPLASIMAIANYIKMARGRPGYDAFLVDAVADINAEVQRCGEIVRGMLKFARNEATEKNLASLNDVVLKSVAICREHAASHAVKITTELNPVIPEVLMNFTAMEQVAVNLLRNAVDAAVAEGAQGRGGHQVVIKSFLKGLKWCGFVVEDNGVGLSDKERKRIFDPFYTTRRKKGAVGLGLSISHGIVEEHGGKIRASTSTLGGVAIEVVLPIPGER